MIHDDPADINAFSAARLERLRRFLASRGAPETNYRLAPMSRPRGSDTDAEAIIQAEYGGEPFRNGDPATVIRWPTPSGLAQVRTTRSEARFLIAFAFDRPENLALLTDLPADTDPARAVTALGLDPALLKRSVGQYLPGSYVAPDRGGWASFLVEPYGQVVYLADAAQPAPILQFHAANILQEQQNLAGRMAEFVVPIAEADLPNL